MVSITNAIGHVLNEQGTGYELIISCYEYSVSIEFKMEHIIWKNIQKVVNLPKLTDISLNAKAWYTFKIIEFRMGPVPPIHTYSFAIKPITVKFGKFTNFWMLFQFTCPNQEFNPCWIFVPKRKYVPTKSQVPCSFRTWLIQACMEIIINTINSRLKDAQCLSLKRGLDLLFKLICIKYNHLFRLASLSAHLVRFSVQ